MTRFDAIELLDALDDYLDARAGLVAAVPADGENDVRVVRHDLESERMLRLLQGLEGTLP